MNEKAHGEMPLDASPLVFADIRFVRETVCNKVEKFGRLEGFEELLDWVISVLETDVAIARASGKASVMDGRLTLSAAVDRAEHLTHLRRMI